MPLKPGDKLLWRSELVTFVCMVDPPGGELSGPPALYDVYVPAAWVRQDDNSIVPVPFDQLTYDGSSLR